MARKRDFLEKAKGIHPDLHTLLTPIFERLEALETQAATIGQVTAPLATHLDADGNKLQNVADPVDAGDVVNLQTLKKYVDAAIRQQSS